MEKSVLKMESLDRDNCSVAVCGSSLNKYHVDILRKQCDPSEYIICFVKEDDTDGKYFNKLIKMCQKYNNYGQFSFIYDFKNRLNLKDSPIDKGSTIFEELLKERVVVKSEWRNN